MINFPEQSKLSKIYWRIKSFFMWPQCKAAHRPYKHLRDAECGTFYIGKNANKKTYYCMRNKYHLGKHCDIHERKWQ